jgi:hypothetical protein
MRKAVIYVLLLSQLLSILSLAGISLTGTADAAPSGELVSVTYSSGNDQQIDGYLLSDQSSKTVSFTVGPKPGKVIKDLAWYDSNGNRLRAAHGDWLNKPSFSTTSEPIQGTPLDVISVSTSPYAGIFVWDRSGGSNEWRAGYEGQTYSSNSCPPLATKDEWGLRAYPNCTSRVNRQPIPITSPYIVESAGVLYKKTIKADVVAQETIKATVSVNDMEFEYITSHGKRVEARAFKHLFSNIKFEFAESKTKVVVSYDHYSGPEALQSGHYTDWANPGARQMWYFMVFDFTVTAKTYLYRDKQLYVVWGDAEPDKPDLVAVDITADGSIEVGKPASFTAKWRLDGKKLEPNQCYNVKVTEEANTLKVDQFCGTQQGQQLSMNFTYTFTSATEKTFRLVVDSSASIAEIDETNNELSKTFKAVDMNKMFTGDFDVLPPVIEFRDSFQLKPKNFVFNGCTYDSHRYKIERNGQTYYTSWATGRNDSHSYSYSTYPWIIGIGTHFITLEIRTKDCGIGEKATHTLVVNGPQSNRPPEFEIGFVYPFNPTKPVHEVVEGTVMHLIYITDPSVPTPYDPDGDPIEFLGFDFSESSEWAKTIPQKYPEYGDGYHNIVMNGIGYHAVKATMRDIFGATTTRTTYIRVIPPNPIPVIEGPKEVKEGRPLPQPFSSAKSYSPAGRTIDHSRDEWGNLKEVYTKPGKEIITLHVYDSIGLKSLEPAVHELTVLPDEPPVAKLEVEPRGIRGQTYYVYNKSYSPDGDQIVSVQYKMRYDAENNGFDDDPWTDMTGDMTRAVFKPDRVGKYQFYVKVCEDYGKCDDTLSDPVELTMIDIVNLAPEVSFELEGKNPQPDHSVARIYTPAGRRGIIGRRPAGPGDFYRMVFQ